ncbi:hypothetical protein [Phaeodactylibacter luteus]|uniref:Lipoprotein n=1 Tax=Phaeodactylibacter luteus TaxID=1564516 RepID=A0A5C6S1B0_9BACT|nr:hypothetical protein [Phaeodactylibacter luteus]TXB68005.1 hypothetical protein FRY97_03925 [Phaeodactylibacter luteus]
MKNLFLILALLAYGLYSCQPGPAQGAEAPAQDTTATEADPRLDFTILPGERVGLVDLRSASEADVLQAYGSLAQKDSVYLGEGLFEQGVVLFKENPKNRVYLYWDPLMSPRQPSFVSIYGEGRQTDWSTPEGLTIGMSIEQVEQLNGRAFELYGFGWDYGGYVSNWNGGSLEGKGISLRFEPNEDATTAVEVLGDVALSSDAPAVRQAQPFVSELTFSDPTPDPMSMMQGGWRSTTDESYEIIIEGNQVSHFSDQRLMYTAAIEADPGCTSEACAVTGTAPEGFCFIEKGEFDAQCNLVITANETTLEYTAIGAAGGSLVFERVD